MVQSQTGRHPWKPMTPHIKAVAKGKPDTVPEVLKRLTRLKTYFDRLPGGSSNPSASFNDLYLRITRRVLDYLQKGLFHEPDFLKQLDVEFAARYLRAVELMATDGDVPKAWLVVFRAGPHVSSISAAAAGVNAHVNFDLSFALLETLRDQAAFPDAPPVDSPPPPHRVPAGGEKFADYVMVNQIFHQEMPKLIKHFSRHDNYLQWLHQVHGHYFTENELVIVTRGIAWDVCRDDLWPDKDHKKRLQIKSDRIDARAAAIGRIIVSPATELLLGPLLDTVRAPLRPICSAAVGAFRPLQREFQQFVTPGGFFRI